MQKYYKVPLIFLMLAALLGLFLRWQFIIPTHGVRYTYFLHGHSHIMFLGWVFNVLYLSFIHHNCPESVERPGLRLFLFLQVLVVAMMISFPIQGYGTYSIVFSTLHTLAVLAFIPFYFYKTRRDNRISTLFSRIAWLFFFISTAGPFGLGYLMANGMGNSVWYNLSIYYYLHFQYNGFFLFGVFALFYQLLESWQIPFSHAVAKRFGFLMAGACIPAYALSTLFARPGILLNAIGAFAALIQLFALALLVRELIRLAPALAAKLSSTGKNLLLLALVALIAKSLLQLLSAHPDIATLAFELRPVVIAYLHLVLVGVVTFFLITWYLEKKLLRPRRARAAAVSLFVGFLGSQLCLVIAPWWSTVVGDALSAATIIFGFSVFMVFGALLLVTSFAPHPSEPSIARTPALATKN